MTACALSASAGAVEKISEGTSPARRSSSETRFTTAMVPASSAAKERAPRYWRVSKPWLG